MNFTMRLTTFAPACQSAWRARGADNPALAHPHHYHTPTSTTPPATATAFTFMCAPGATPRKGVSRD